MDVYNPGNPNNNPLCGRDVTITFGGEEFQAKVVDTCEGCAEGDLDLSEGFFSEVTGGQMSRGRIGGVQWKWT
jgi:expansin (peptidoglycan-binding protein)